MNPEKTSSPTIKSPEKPLISSKISRLTLAVSMLALSVFGGCNKPKQDGSNHLTPALHLSCTSSDKSSQELTANVTYVSNIKLTQENSGTFCTYYTSDMHEAGNQMPVTVSCKQKANNNGSVSKKINGITIEVSQSNAVCEITNE